MHPALFLYPPSIDNASLRVGKSYFMLEKPDNFDRRLEPLRNPNCSYRLRVEPVTHTLQLIEMHDFEETDEIPADLFEENPVFPNAPTAEMVGFLAKAHRVLFEKVSDAEDNLQKSSRFDANQLLNCIQEAIPFAKQVQL